MRNDDERLRLYLLGELPDEESDRLEQRLLVEDDLFELSDAIEAEILEARSRGELSPQQRNRIDWLLSRSPRLRSRAALVRGLASVEDEDGWGTILPFSPKIDMSRRTVRFAALAASLLLVASVVWLALSLAPKAAEMTMAAGGAVEGAGTPRPDPAEPHAPAEPPRPRVPEPQPDAVARLETPAPPAPPTPPVTAVFQLSMLVLRGEEDSVLEVPAGTEQVEIHILLDDGYERYAPYTAVLSGGGDDLRLTGLKAKPTANGFVVVLPVPREELPAGQYQLDLSGETRSGEPVEITLKQFEVRG